VNSTEPMPADGGRGGRGGPGHGPGQDDSTDSTGTGGAIDGGPSDTSGN